LLSRAPGRGQRVTAVARLGERIGAEANANVGGDNLVDDRRIDPCVEVVDELSALVAENARSERAVPYGGG
ncbi:MAG: hypothetical protein LH616_04860, partial [Ilumatobacteraceae bacterium]|nr:hypothetical protein [Ilumatobacteraceae bacterium]